MRLAIDGAVLAGGQSRRMGEPKEALLLPDDTTLLAHARNVLRAAVSGTVWVSRAYGQSPAHPWDIADASPDRGPLSGLATVLNVAQSPVVAILAVDLPCVPPELFSQLYQRFESHPEALIVYPRSLRDHQPLAALWRTDALSILKEALTGTRVPRLFDVVQRLRPQVVDVDHPEWLTNVNTPEDWNKMGEHR